MPKRAMVDCESLFLDRRPDLATAQRAQRIRPKGDIGSEHVASRALPLNRKIFEAPSLLHQKRSTPQLPEFQEFHLRGLDKMLLQFHQLQHMETTLRLKLERLYHNGPDGSTNEDELIEADYVLNCRS